MKNQTYKNTALAALRGNWAPAVLAAVIFVVIIAIWTTPREISALSSTLGMSSKLILSGVSLVLGLLVVFPVEIGIMNAYRNLLDGDSDVVGNLFRNSIEGYFRNIWCYLLYFLLVMLWTILLIVPGIIMAMAYAMTPFILKEHPEYSVVKALEESRHMMSGHKWEYFVLQLSFIGWILLSILTLFIGLFWLEPYMLTTNAAFYEDIKAQYESQE